MSRAVIVLIALLALATAQGAENTLHSFERIVLSEQFFAEGANFADFNKDGKMDIVAGPFWFEGPDFKTKHEYYPPPDGKGNKPVDKKGYAKNFFAFTYDFNADGYPDILIFGFPGEDASWFENSKGKDGPWTRHKIFNVVDNESPQFEDITGDGKPEIICTTGGFVGYVEADWTDAAKPWTFKPISVKGGWQKYTHGLGIGDVNGDGKKDILDSNGWWEQPADSTKGEPWKLHPSKFARGGAQMHVYDINGDGKNDVITSIAAHEYGLSWHKQLRNDKGEISFKEHVILPTSNKGTDNYGVQFSQLHAVDMIDMDGDGVKDIITGKRHWAHGPSGDPEPQADPVLYWFQTVRGGPDNVTFIPYLVDKDSGIGTQVVTGDINGDKLPDIVVGNKRGIFAFIHKTAQVSKEEWDKAQPQPVKK